MHPNVSFIPPAALRLLAVSAAVLALAGCDRITATLGLNEAQQQDVEAKAIGGACRHAQRGPEDCYTLNPKARKAAVFEGWREMDQYMRENNIEGSPSVIARPVTPEPPPRRPASRAAPAAEQ